MKTCTAGHVDSFYSQTGQQPRLHAALGEDISTQVCIVGGGMAGLTTALELARRGIRTVLVEAARLGWSASGRNGGFVSPGFAESIFEIEAQLGLEAARELYVLSCDGVGYVRKTIADAGRSELIGGHGWLKLIRHDQTGLLEHRAQRMARDYGATVDFVGSDALQAYVSSERYHGGLIDTAPFHIQPLDYCLLLADLAEAQGAVLAENSPAKNIVRGNTEQTVMLENGVRITAEHVVVATSAHRGPLPALNRAIVPVSTYVVAANNGAAGFGGAIRFSGCIGDTRRASDYYRVLGSGSEQQLVWGGRITTRLREPDELAKVMREDILAVYPQLDGLEVTHAWQGMMGYARHKMPLIGQMADRLWYAAAFGGHGINTTAMAGTLLAAAIAEGDDRYRLFGRFAPRYAGGIVGRIAVQLEYWRLQFLDRLEERRAANR